MPPTFDPTQPYTLVAAPPQQPTSAVPTFDPSQAYTPVTDAPVDPAADAAVRAKNLADPTLPQMKTAQPGLGATLGSSTLGQMVHGAIDQVAGVPQFLNRVAPSVALPNSDPTTGMPIDYGYGPGVVPDSVKKQMANVIPNYESNYNAARPGIVTADPKTGYPVNSTPDIASDIGGIAPWTLGAPEKLAASGLNVGRSIVPEMVMQGLKGAGISALNPVDNDDPSKSGTAGYAEEKLKQAGLGFLFGAGTNAASRVIKPNVSPELQRMIDAGAFPSVDQTMRASANPAVKSAGDFVGKLSGLPFIGPPIQGAQLRSQAELPNILGNKALSDAGLVPLSSEALAGNGQKVADEVSKKFDAAYEPLIPQMSFDATNQPPGAPSWASIITGLKNQADTHGPDASDQFSSILDNMFNAKMRGTGTASMTGDDLSSAISDLRRQSRSLKSNPDSNMRDLGDTVSQLNNAIQNNAAYNSPPEVTMAKDRLDEAYRNYAVLRDASAAAKNSGGNFTPAQLGTAVAKNDNSVSRGNTARGRGYLQGLVNDSNAVITKVPDSSTAGRANADAIIKHLGALITGAGAGEATGAGLGVGLGVPVGAGLASYLANSRPGTQLLNHILTGRQGQVPSFLADRVNQLGTAAAGQQTTGTPLSTDEQMQNLMNGSQ